MFPKWFFLLNKIYKYILSKNYVPKDNQILKPQLSTMLHEINFFHYNIE